MHLTNEEIREKIYALQDVAYRDFQKGLVPSLSEDRFIGVRTDPLKKLAKELLKMGGYEDFLVTLPHYYFDEDQLHAFIISEIKDYDECVGRVTEFLPYVNNWATCDQLNPAVFKKNKNKLMEFIDLGLSSDHTYTVRFCIRMLMSHYLDKDFNEGYLEKVAKTDTSDYYLSMMVAWYFATALVKQYEKTIPYIENNRLDATTHNRAIRKALESFRTPEDVKNYLRTLKRQA